jgi:hypothetical protein
MKVERGVKVVPVKAPNSGCGRPMFMLEAKPFAEELPVGFPLLVGPSLPLVLLVLPISLYSFAYLFDNIPCVPFLHGYLFISTALCSFLPLDKIFARHCQRQKKMKKINKGEKRIDSTQAKSGKIRKNSEKASKSGAIPRVISRDNS